jgi:hypothetical protein
MAVARGSANRSGSSALSYHRPMNGLDINPRRLGTGLLAFGMAGVILAGLIAAALIGGAVAARNLDERLLADQERIAASLTRLTLTMDSLAVTTDHAGETLATSRDAIAHASDLLGELSAASADVGTALDISILGSQPFATAAEKLHEVGRALAVFQQDAQALALNLDANATDAAKMADEIRSIKTQVAELAAIVAGFDRIDEVVGLLIGGIVLGALLTAWVGLAAAGCAWVGWRLRRTTSASPVDRAAPAG